MAQVEAISIANGPHDILSSGMAARAIAFFGLDTGGPCRVSDTVNAWNTCAGSVSGARSRARLTRGQPGTRSDRAPDA